VEQRRDLLARIIEAYKARYDDLGAAITAEMGAPAGFALKAQAGSGLGHLKAALAALETFEFEESIGRSKVFKEPIGVCGLITPWNWPINQIACKVAPALAAGCTMVLKPSEIAPANAKIFAEILHAAGVPAGVFNLVQGDGPGVGAAMSAHPDIDMMSFTGSTRAGVLVARAAAETVKRVAQELGGKSANIILESAPLEEAVVSGVRNLVSNSGQSCNAPTRMLVPAGRYEEAVRIAAAAADRTVVGDPLAAGTHIGPVVSATQFEKIQALIRKGIEEGARVAAGGPGKPAGLETGYYVRPTVFRDVDNDMTIAREEIFGPVLCMIPYATVDEAVGVANDTIYGLSGYVYAGSTEEAMAVARRLRTGMVHLNGAPNDNQAPFGGYRQSGNGREWGVYGIEDFLEIKAVMGGA
jgi:aldehyde dehydrogenase (NAD+)